MTKTLVFLHIDRTGGMAIRKALAEHFEFSAIKPVPHHRQARVQPNYYPLDYQADLIKQHTNFKHKPTHKLIMGHWDTSILSKIEGEKQVLTILRDPVARVASLGKYMANERMFADYHKEIATNGLVDFLYKYRLLWANAMSKQLAGARWSSAYYEPMQAVENLINLDFVGFTEDLPTTDFILDLDLNLSILNHSAGPKTELIQQITEMVQNESPDDIRLYSIAKRWQYAI